MSNALRQKFAKALAAARELQVAKTKTADTGKYTYTYATLGDVMHTVDQACDEAGLTWFTPFNIHPEHGLMSIDLHLIDLDDGDVLELKGPAIQVKGDPQATGSAITYFRRYVLTTEFRLNVVDDDGAQASRAVTQPGQRTPAEKEARDLIKKLEPDARAQIQTEFKTAFNSTLTNLPESQHGEALTWVKNYIANELS